MILQLSLFPESEWERSPGLSADSLVLPKVHSSSLKMDIDPLSLYLLETKFLLTEEDGELLQQLCPKKTPHCESLKLEVFLVLLQPMSIHSTEESREDYGTTPIASINEHLKNQDGLKRLHSQRIIVWVKSCLPQSKVTNLLISGGLLVDIWQTDGGLTDSPQEMEIRAREVIQGKSLFVQGSISILKWQKELGESFTPLNLKKEQQSSFTLQTKNSINIWNNLVERLKEKHCLDLSSLLMEIQPVPYLMGGFQETVTKANYDLAAMSLEGVASVSHSLWAWLYLPKELMELSQVSESAKFLQPKLLKEDWLINITSGLSAFPSVTALPLLKAIMDGSRSEVISLLELELSTTLQWMKTNLTLQTGQLFTTANHSAQPDNNSAPKMSVTFGPKLPELFAIFDLHGYALKTSPTYLQLNLGITSEKYSGSFPRWGLMLSGECYRLPPWGQFIEESESGLLQRLPTPKAQDGSHPGVTSRKKGQTRHLLTAVMMPTPTANDWKDGSANQADKDRSPNLNDAVAMLATPVKRNSNNDWGKASKGGRNLCNDTGCSTQRSLNPHLVEAMMGFPQGWTDVYLPTQSLQTGSPQPQSPASLGSVLKKLEALREKIKRSTSDCGESINQSADSIKNK